MNLLAGIGIVALSAAYAVPAQAGEGGFYYLDQAQQRQYRTPSQTHYDITRGEEGCVVVSMDRWSELFRSYGSYLSEITWCFGKMAVANGALAFKSRSPNDPTKTGFINAMLAMTHGDPFAVIDTRHGVILNVMRRESPNEGGYTIYYQDIPPFHFHNE